MGFSYKTWASSWGSSWAGSWGQSAAPAPTPDTVPGGGGSGRLPGKPYGQEPRKPRKPLLELTEPELKPVEAPPVLLTLDCHRGRIQLVGYNAEITLDPYARVRRLDDALILAGPDVDLAVWEDAVLNDSS